MNFLSTLLLARFLGIEEFGRFTLAWMVVLFANSLQNAAIIQPMLSIGPKHAEAEAPAYYGAVIVQQAVVAAFAFGAVLIGAQASALALPDWGIGGLGVPLAVAMLAGQAQDFLRRYLFVRGRTVAAVVNDGIRYLGQLILLYVVAGYQPATISAAHSADRSVWHWVQAFGVPSDTDRSGRGTRML